MSVAENIAFGLEVRGVADRPQRASAPSELLELVGAAGRGDKRSASCPAARSSAWRSPARSRSSPQVLLLDEPLSALDLKLRQHMRAELRAIQRRTGVTFIYITHDQGEALAMSDRVAVMSHGVIEQVGDGHGDLRQPGDAFVASFVGENNRVSGRVRGAGRRLRRDRDGARAVDAADAGACEPGDAAIAVRAARTAAAGRRAASPRPVSQTAFEGHRHPCRPRRRRRGQMTMSLGRDHGAHTLTPGAAVHVGYSAEDAIVLRQEA